MPRATLVGRADLLALADRRWAAARAGAGHLLLLAGEAGIGKTRLLDEIASRAGDGCRVLRAAAFPADAQSTGGLLLDLAGSLRRSGEVETAATFRQLLGAGGSDATARPRRVVVGDLVDLLRDLMGTQPTVLGLEDLHWCDEFSLEVLDRLAALLDGVPCLVVATYRSDEIAPGSALRAWRARLLEQRRAEELRLPRLTAADTAAVATELHGAALSTAVLDGLQARSDGIPLHIEELVAAPDGTVPDTVAEAVLSRAATLDPPTRAVLIAAAVIGRSFDVDLLAAVVGAPVEALDGPIRVLVAQHFVRPADAASYDFRHALMRDAVYADVPIGRRRELHARVADAADRAGFRDAVVSEHLESAHQPADAYRRSMAAARAAARVSAHRDAAALFRRAERTQPSSATAADRAGLSAELAAELAAVDENGSATIQYEQAMALYRDAGDEVAAARLVPALVAVRHLLGATLEERRLALEDALGRLPDDAPEDVRSALLAALAAAHMLDRRLEDALRYGRRATELGPGDIGASVDLDATVGSVLVFAGRAAEGWTLLENAIGRGGTAGLEAATARTYRMLGSSASVLVEYRRATTWIDRGLTYTARTERWNDHHYLRAHLGHVRWATGDLAAADAQASRALADDRDGVTTRITARIALGYVDLARGELATATAHLDEARTLGERMHELQRFSPALWGLAEVALRQGDAGAAAALCDQGAAESARVGDAAYLFPFVLTGTRARLALRDATGAAEWVSRCAAALKARGIRGTLPALDHAIGLLRLEEGRMTDAHTHLARAAAEWDAFDRFWEGTLARFDLAGCAAKSGRPGTAREYAAAGVARARASGAHLLVRLGERDGASPGSAARGLSRRELEVAGLIAAGATNRQIAERLQIAPKTASAHVEHILAKLGVARRAEIAAWIARER